MNNAGHSTAISTYSRELERRADGSPEQVKRRYPAWRRELAVEMPAQGFLASELS
jgi:hypothetical protein